MLLVYEHISYIQFIKYLPNPYVLQKKKATELKQGLTHMQKIVFSISNLLVDALHILQITKLLLSRKGCQFLSVFKDTIILAFNMPLLELGQLFT